MKPVFTRAATADEDQLVELMREFYAYDHIAFDEEKARRALRQLAADARFGVVHLIGAEGAGAFGYLVITFGFSLEFHGRDAFVD